jgi:excisionase family DNA binding protein
MNLETLIGEIVRTTIRDELRTLHADLKALLAKASPQLPGSNADVLLSVEQVAAKLGVTEQSVRVWIRSGALRAARPGVGNGAGRIYRVLPADLEAFISAKQRVPNDIVDIKAAASRIVARLAQGRKT